MTNRTLARCLMLVVSVMTIAGCRGVGDPDVPVAAGTWGSGEAAVTVTANGVHLEFPCASGDITQALLTDSNGDFSVEGVYTRQSGPGLNPQAARYSGHIDNQTMTLSVTLSQTNQAIGSFTLKLGTPASFAKCV
jgi:hypothetical protein